MPVYKGELSLINFNDGNAEGEAGVGIKSTQVYYAASESGTTPPDLEGVALITDANQLLSFAEISTTFHVKNESLYAIKDNKEIGLSTDKDYIVGIAGWGTTIPDVAPGNYLWTKTVFIFTDDSQSVTYTVAKQGEKGDRGESSSTYKLKLNQTEVLKFVDKHGEMSVSPEILTVQIIEEERVLDINLSSFAAHICNIRDQKWYQLPHSIFTVQDSVLNVNLKNLLAMNGDVELATEASSIFTDNEGIIRLQYEQIGEDQKVYTISEYLSVRYGMNKDMASFSLEANGFVSAIQNTKLVFNANGLTAQNGAFRILNNEQESVFYADDNGNLTLVGVIRAEGGYFKGDITGASGTFAGRIEATDGFFGGRLESASGSFSGEITAASGSIGGFTINENSLTSVKTSQGNPLIVLNGVDGTIEAENIVLGNGARIRDYLVIGENVKLISPKNKTNSFITVKNTEDTEILQVRADGVIRAGDDESAVLIDGANGSIFSSNYNDSQGWRISNTNSIFNDVTIRGSIKASVLEYGQVQTIGGIIIARPSSRILNITQEQERSVLLLESTEGFNAEDWCLISKDLSKIYAKVVSIDHEAKKVLLDQMISEDYIGLPIICFGTHGSIGVGINGSMNSSFVPPNAVTIFEFDNEAQSTIPRVVLGKLPNEEQYGYAKNTYGLYAENVLLKGSLVTQTEFGNSKKTYSGISTLYTGEDVPNSDSYKEWFGDDTGEILLWAGAEGTDKESIENSKFFVDRNGNLFAGSGYFKGTIITDATITASEIKTATLTGHGANPALTIQDATNGIVFLQGNNEIFKLTNESIVANTSEFSFNNSFKINQNGEMVVPKIFISGSAADTVSEILEKESLVLGENYIGHSSSFKTEEMSGPIDSQLKITGNFIECLLENQTTMRITNQETKIHNSLYLSGAIKYNELMEYKPVYENSELIGYDLFIE